MLKLNQMIGVSALALIAAACSQGDVKSSSNETPAATAENGQGHTGVVQGSGGKVCRFAYELGGGQSSQLLPLVFNTRRRTAARCRGR